MSKFTAEYSKVSTTRSPMASVAQLDTRPTGDQEVVCSDPRNILSWRFDHEIFSVVILPPSAVSRRADVSFWRKNAHNTG